MECKNLERLIGFEISKLDNIKEKEKISVKEAIEKYGKELRKEYCTNNCEYKEVCKEDIEKRTL